MKTKDSIIFYVLFISSIIILLSIMVYLANVLVGFNWKEVVLVIVLLGIGTMFYKYCEKRKKKEIVNSYWNNMKCIYLVIISTVIFVQISTYFID